MYSDLTYIKNRESGIFDKILILDFSEAERLDHCNKLLKWGK